MCQCQYSIILAPLVAGGTGYAAHVLLASGRTPEQIRRSQAALAQAVVSDVPT